MENKEFKELLDELNKDIKSDKYVKKQFVNSYLVLETLAIVFNVLLAVALMIITSYLVIVYDRWFSLLYIIVMAVALRKYP